MRGAGARVLLWGALVACLAGIAFLTVGASTSFSNSGTSSVNLTLFQEIERALRSDSRIAWLNLIGNLAMFAPLGAVLVALMRRLTVVLRVMVATVVSGMLSAAIEIAQLALGRVADIDDVLLNTLGAFGGAVVAAVVIGVANAVRRRRYDGGRASSSAGRAADF
ncbi:VanZ family protein [Demequina lignilytica]|uniref:VanZ family protein n=1 Tax=Demequina lignilytica TaxID=3051663 RepID=UPI00345D9BE5